MEHLLHRLAAVVDVRDAADAARLGRWLLIFQGLVIVATGRWVQSGEPNVVEVLSVGAGFVAAGAVSTGLPWHRWPRVTLAAFPHVAFALLAALSFLAPTAAPAYVSMITLWFMFVGVVAPPGTGLKTLPAATLTFVLTQDHFGPQQIVRLVLAATVWLVVSTVLSLRAAASRDRADDLLLQAETDALTGLPNRRALEESLTRLAVGDLVTVIDLDHFKQVNDTGGHEFGDRVLVDFARTLEGVVRAGDLVARFGGEEFVLVLPHGAAEGCGATSVMGRLRQRWAELHPDITWSAGAACHQSGQEPHATLREADHALYRAKANGRDRVETSGCPDPAPARAKPAITTAA